MIGCSEPMVERNGLAAHACWRRVCDWVWMVGHYSQACSRATAEAQVEILEALETFPSTLPTRRDSMAMRADVSARPRPFR